MASSETSTASRLPSARGYQLEMLNESLRRNIVVALDTGSGKTLIAVLRIKSFLEQESRKVAWFLAPTVVLCEQQKDVIAGALPVSVGLISGALEPNQWRDHSLWRRVVSEHRAIVSTPQVLLDAMRNGHINLGQDIGLLIFDEAHHVADKHPYNMIMQEQYFRIPLQISSQTDMTPAHGTEDLSIARPAVLGLTASPSFGGNVAHAFQMIEANLDSVILAPQLHREELSNFAHRPHFKHLLYTAPTYVHGEPTSSRNLAALRVATGNLNIEDDPYVQSLRARLQTLPPGPERTKTDQRLSKTIDKQDSYTHKGLRDLQNTAEDISIDLGPWAADWYIAKVVERAKAKASPYRTMLNNWQHREKAYLQRILDGIQITPVSYEPDDIHRNVSDKVHALIECLEEEKATVESLDEEYSCLIFVTRRDGVLALAEILNHHPRTKSIFRVGCLLGSSDSAYRRALLDITRELLTQTQSETLGDFRIGEKNVIVSTAVAEEGIDIQACGTVIRWDPPQNMVSWAQSRGRARRKRSTFVLMFRKGGTDEAMVHKWMSLEAEMTRLYYAERGRKAKQIADEASTAQPEENGIVFTVPSTGALLTLDSAVPRLEHFCAVIPHGVHVPYYDVDPPDLPEEWHLDPTAAVEPYEGPFGATVTLPKVLAAELRVFKVDRVYPTKRSARRHVAYQAYLALYEAGLLNEYLLPLTSVMEPDLENEVKELLKDVQKRAGTESVSLQMNPWAPSEGADRKEEITVTNLTIGDLPPLKIFTRIDPRLPPGKETFFIYPGDSPPLAVALEPLGHLSASEYGAVEEAQSYTHRLFWTLHATRMKWDERDFAYLFLPGGDTDDRTWSSRREWWVQSERDRGMYRQESSLFAAMDTFGAVFSWPQDLVLVNDVRRPQQRYQFLSWTFDALPPEAEEELRERHRLFEGTPIQYPLVNVQPLPRRVNLLIPTESITSPQIADQCLLLPSRSQVVLASQTDIEYALYLPSILRYLAMSMTLHSFRESILSSTALKDIPPELLMIALTAPASQERDNYQRLETLGDTTLKFLVSLQLLADYPLWHEGYLSKKKDHTVSNAQLAKQAVRVELYRWIIRDRFIPRKWKPLYRRVSEDPTAMVGDTIQPPDKKPSPQKEDVSTKVLADVVESLIGAAKVTGGFDLATEMGKLFGCGITWQPVLACVDKILKRVEHLPDFPTQITDVEIILGYEFKRKALLVEALTHSSHQSSLTMTSYERMEFAGDAVLDMIVTDYLYNAPGKNYSPGHMHLRKSAVVNSHFLAFICLRASHAVDVSMPAPDKDQPDGRIRIVVGTEKQRVHLFQCLLHSSHRVLEDQVDSFARYARVQADIERRLAREAAFPWASLTRLQASKFLSDMVESLLGAIYIDAGGDLDVVRGVLRTLGILPVLERIVNEGVDVQHPVSRLAMWAAHRQKKIVYRYGKAAGKMTCTVIVRPIRRTADGKDIAAAKKAEGMSAAAVKRAEEEEDDEDDLAVAVVTGRFRGRASQNEIRFAAAEMAIDRLSVETMDELIRKDEAIFLDLDDVEDEKEEGEN